MTNGNQYPLRVVREASLARPPRDGQRGKIGFAGVCEVCGDPLDAVSYRCSTPACEQRESLAADVRDEHPFPESSFEGMD